MKGIFYWFKDSSKMKRWIMLILVGIVFSSFGMANMIVSDEAITFGQAAKIIAYFVIGFTCVVLGLVFINKRNMELFIEATDNRLEKNEKVNVNAKSEKVTITNSNIVVILDNSGSMDTKADEIVWDGECKHYCYYRQLKRKEQECEELKEKVKELRQGWINCDKERNLQEANSEFRPALKSNGFLTRDPRMKERKKYGLKKARKAPQFSKR